MVFYEDSGAMFMWETEDEATAVGRVAAGASLPTPLDTPYRTPSRGSRNSRRSVTPPGKRLSATPPLPTDKTDRASKRSSKDFATDETISILDPRRFTPTLHANLVSEILALRRDQEEKLKAIENLEVALHASKEDQESLQENLSGATKENRSLRRQLDLLEGGTSSALKELARERDEAVDAAAEARKRLDANQKRLRVHEDDSRRVHSQWAEEREGWGQEKRKYEHKIHIAESRLKMLLEEVAQFQAAQADGLAGRNNESDAEDQGKDNDAASVRTMSMTNSIRFSMINGNGMGKPNGQCLADELNFDGDDATDYETDHGYGRDSVLSNHMRNMSRESVMSKLHRRNQSNNSLMKSDSVARARFMNQPALERLEDVIREDGEEMPPPPRPKATYTDSAVQYSPPPSPKLKPVKPTSTEAAPPIPARASMRRDDGSESPARADGEVGANQRRKRIHVARPVVPEPVAPEPVAPQIQMVSTASQTVAEKPKPAMASSSTQMTTAAMVSSSTQTDAPPPTPPVLSKPEIGLMQIPSISIHPPTSRPSTPKKPRLPQLFKDFGCQVAILSAPATAVSSAGVQTDEIRVDKRLDKLPVHLHPSAVTSRPTSPAIQGTEPDDMIKFTPVPGHLPPRNPRRLTSQRSLSEIPSSPLQSTGEAVNMEETHDAYPGNNDDGPLSSQKAPLRRPHRISSLFAGFDGNSSDEADEFGDADFSDPEFRTALSAPKPNGKGKRSSGNFSDSQLPSKQSGRHAVRSMGPPSTKLSFPDIKDRRASVQDGTSSKSSDRAPPAAGPSRFSMMRKAVMSSHQGQKSPDLSEIKDPPYPIPTRASSRRPPFSASAPSDGQQSPTRSGFPGRPSRNNSVRKVRSAAAIPRRHRRRNSRSPPPPFSPATEDSVESPGLPPLPHNDITTPRSHGYSSTSTRYSRSTHRHQPSTNTADTDHTGAGSVATSGGQPGATGVVDAIAQTMVGEWMFKYVRRRKSFGPVGESQGRDDSSNDRHRRWVWLAPYERAILWSSKQPSSGSALMGKSGRKLTIQSVLDVKDDNPPPKGANGSVFSRSILILTPQRALKFTACSSERHYLWLTALSFLAHSHQAVPENLTPSSLTPKAMPDFELSQQKPRRPGIRDSIRLAKGKTAMARGGAVTPIGSIMSAAPSSAAQNSDFGVPSLPSIPDFPGLESIKSGTTSGAGYYAQHQRELSRDAAEPPFIPRFNDTRISVTDRANQAMVHGRKRSNTGGHIPPPISFRGFSGPIGGGGSSNGSYHQSTNSTAAASIDTTGSSGVLSNPYGNPGFAGSQRTSEASSRPSGATMNNFFDAIGTVRMEAFISPLAPNPAIASTFNDYPDEQEEMRWRARRRSKEARRRNSRSRRRDSYSSRARDDDFFRSEDPFKGF
ncbi:hypothetical protein RB594_002183 [Gaeumannomyces avenae]